MECLVIAGGDAASVELCGISISERLRRTLRACGFEEPTIFSGDGPAETFLLVRGDCVFDQRLLQLLIKQRAPVVLVDSAVPEHLLPLVSSAPITSKGRLCGAALLTRDWIRPEMDKSLCEGVENGKLAAIDVAQQSWFHIDMHRDLRAYWFPSPSPALKNRAENVILAAAQKGTLDIPALVHAPIETFIVSKLCRSTVTPNQLTILSNICAWGATILFATGHLGGGIAVAVAVGVLDGLDGKLARVKLETSKAGELEHLFDVLFEYSWWIALAYHLHVSSILPEAFSYLGLLIGAEILTALARGSVARVYGKSICDLSVFDRLVRLVGGRRNIYVWIFAIGLFRSAPAGAFRLIAWWGMATAAVQVPRALLALSLRGDDRRRL